MKSLLHDARFVPNERRWGMGYGERHYTHKELEGIVDELHGNVEPTYGPRLFGDITSYSRETRLWVPEGYDATNHPNRRSIDRRLLDPDLPTSQTEVWQVGSGVQEYFRGRYWPLDMHGRPCNPLARELLADPDIGLNTGIGYGYYLGENSVVKVLVTLAGEILMFDRQVAEGFLGGFAIPGDFGITPKQWRQGNRAITPRGLTQTAHRKLRQNGVLVSSTVPSIIAYAQRPVYPVHTLNFWTTEYTLWFQLHSVDEITIEDASKAYFLKEDAAFMRFPPQHLRELRQILSI